MCIGLLCTGLATEQIDNVMVRSFNNAMSTIASHSPLNISETVRNRGLVPKDHQWEIAYGESNVHVTDDVM